MYDLPAIAQIMSFTVGLMGALVAGLSVYVSYKGRHNQFRHVVYGRQMDAYFDISESMSLLYTAAKDIIECWNPSVNREIAGTRLRATLMETHERFTGTVNRALIVLPAKVKAAVNHFNETFLAISAPAENLPANQHEAAPDGCAAPAEELARSYTKAINCIRHHLAIDRLTTGMLREMGIGSESVVFKNHRSGVKPLVRVGRAAH